MAATKTVIITGAGGNLGRVVTQTFLNRGYQVIATVHTAAAKSNLPDHERLQTEVVDLANEQQAAALVEKAINQYHTIEAALMLVGGFTFGGLDQTKSEDIRKQITLNFETAYHIAQPLLPYMLDNNYGRLVFIGAKPALDITGSKNKVAYALSKSLIFQLAGIINQTAKGKNVTATVVVPSIIDTPANREDMPGANPADWVQPQAIADIIAFVCEETAAPLRETTLKVYNNS